MTKLDELVGAARDGVERRKGQTPLEQLRSRVGTLSGLRPFQEALGGGDRVSLIAEFKRSSPSAGAIRPGATVAEVCSAYERGGAAALSVLTEETRFGGSLEDLRAARAACGLPILRKDFIVDTYQLYEAAANGADAVLLIVAALEDELLALLHQEARLLDLDCLVEVHDEEDLARGARPRRRADRDQQPQPQGSEHQPRDHPRADHRRPRRQDRRRRVRLHDPRAAARARAGRRRCGARRREPAARRRPRARRPRADPRRRGDPRAPRRPGRLSRILSRAFESR